MSNIDINEDTRFQNCPVCNVAWGYEHTDGVFYSRLIGLEVRGGYDGVSYWQCPDCNSVWDRWTGRKINEGEEL